MVALRAYRNRCQNHHFMDESFPQRIEDQIKLFRTDSYKFMFQKFLRHILQRIYHIHLAEIGIESGQQTVFAVMSRKQTVYVGNTAFALSQGNIMKFIFIPYLHPDYRFYPFIQAKFIKIIYPRNRIDIREGQSGNLEFLGLLNQFLYGECSVAQAVVSMAVKVHATGY